MKVNLADMNAGYNQLLKRQCAGTILQRHWLETDRDS